MLPAKDAGTVMLLATTHNAHWQRVVSGSSAERERYAAHSVGAGAGTGAGPVAQSKKVNTAEAELECIPICNY